MGSGGVSATDFGQVQGLSPRDRRVVGIRRENSHADTWWGECSRQQEELVQRP